MSTTWTIETGAAPDDRIARDAEAAAASAAAARASEESAAEHKAGAEEARDASQAARDEAVAAVGTSLGKAENLADLSDAGAATDNLDFVNPATGSVSRSVRTKLGDLLSVADFGATGDGSSGDQAKVANAAAAACVQGSRLRFPVGTYNVNGVDLKNVSALADGAVTLVGAPKNAGFLEGFTINGQNTSKVIGGDVMPALLQSGLLVVNYAADSWYVFSKNSGRAGYVGLRMRKGVGDGNPNWDLIREQSAYDVWDCFGYQSIRTAAGRATYGGPGWADFDYTASVIGAPAGTTSGTENAYAQGRRTNVQTDYVDINVTPDADGYVDVIMLATSTSSRAVRAYYGSAAELGSIGYVEVTGTELVGSGDFAAAGPWNTGGGGTPWSIASGKASKAAGTAAALSQVIAAGLVAGTTYKLGYTVSDYAAGSVRPRFTGGTQVDGVARSANSSYVEYLQATVGNTTLAFSPGSTFSGSVDNVSLKEVTPGESGGTRLETVNTRRAAGARLITKRYFVGYSPIILRLVNDDTAFFYLVGVGMGRPGQANPETVFDAWAHYRLGTHYVSNNGAADYAMRDLDLVPPRLVGSYHGEEVERAVPIWMLDGAAVSSWTLNAPKACRTMLLRQHTLVAGKITAKSDHRFGDGWVEKTISLAGTMRTDSVFMGMCLPVADFSEVLHPRQVTTTGDTNEFQLGQSPLVVQRNPTTEQRVYSWHTVFPGEPNMRGGAFIKVGIGSTSYCKRYTGVNLDAEKQFNGATSRMVHLYC